MNEWRFFFLNDFFIRVSFHFFCGRLMIYSSEKALSSRFAEIALTSHEVLTLNFQDTKPVNWIDMLINHENCYHL